MIVTAVAIILLAQHEDKARTLIQEVARTYSKLTSYNDSVVSISTTPSTVWRQTFKTWFPRPGRWRTDYSEVLPDGSASKIVVWIDGKSPKFWDGDEVTPAPNVSLGYGSLAMVGGNFVKLVPSLLDSKAIDDSFLSELVRPVLLQDAKIGATVCRRIQSEEPSASNVVIWIDIRSKLILRIVRSANSPHFGPGKSIVDYRPVANPKIPVATFDFVPSGAQP